MIISHIIGGLGNQMFQYAVGRSMSFEHDLPFRLDISGFDRYEVHNGFELQHVFCCPVELANEGNVRSILGWQSSPFVRRVLSWSSMSVLRCKGFVVEPHFHYWPGIVNGPQDSYLTGYWQSDKYFERHATVIRSDFTFKPQLTNRNTHFAEQISKGNAVSLHVRRGDYAKNPKTTATHGLCSLDYYHSAIRHIAERVDRPNFFVFSDDAPWVRANLAIDYPCVYIDNNQGSESYNDMRLMSMCKHHIIANSSFSWWGAWLNASSEKIVVAPRRWFANNTDVSDLFPGGWVTL
jgi:hypothetical protein